MISGVVIDNRTLQDIRFLNTDEEEMIECFYCDLTISKSEARPTTDGFLICIQCFKDNLIQCEDCGRIMELGIDHVNKMFDSYFCDECFADKIEDGFIAVVDESVNVQYAEGI